MEICNECGQMFMTVAQLKIHKRMYHGFAEAEQKQRRKLEKERLDIDWIGDN